MPDSLDWRSLGIVPNVINQGQCTSSIFFAEGLAIQSCYALNTRKYLPISYSQLIACIGDGNCDVFQPIEVYDYVAKCGAPTTHSTDRINCYYDRTTSVPVIEGEGGIVPGNETDLAVKLYTEGPLTVGVDSSQPTFQFYSGGIYYEPECTTTPDHVMLLIGYGDTNFRKYWIVQNSWGTEWGLQGYILMSRERENNCGISSFAKYPIFGTSTFNPDESCY